LKTLLGTEVPQLGQGLKFFDRTFAALETTSNRILGDGKEWQIVQPQEEVKRQGRSHHKPPLERARL
jgi:hypothetical protein